MAEAPQFFTGRQLSNETFTVIAPNTNYDGYSAAEAAAKNRVCTLAAGDFLGLPDNPYRASVTIDNSTGTSAVTLNDVNVVEVGNVPAGLIGEFSIRNGNITPGIYIIITNTSGCIVTELSYI